MFRESDYYDARLDYEELTEKVENLKKAPGDNSKEIEKLERERLDAFDRMCKCLGDALDFDY